MENKSINIDNENIIIDGDNYTDDKPIIYIYNAEGKEVTIKLSEPDRLICSYPLYNDSWVVDVITKEGTIIDTKTKKKLYALYYEAIVSEIPRKYLTYGFNVSRDDIANFLDSKLSEIGLNFKERNEFIMYWLPKLAENEYTHIYFETNLSCINSMSEKLVINPKPENINRVYMIFESCNELSKYKKQVFKQFNREGYHILEWGGSEVTLKSLQ